ncbi:hypothetical protein [Jeotgalibacillus salarius]|uniref:DUF4362 domain-containing protein n=1 Tax=Jeotgalibacillus salarius TaxID=546023 RepID=A0A4Y8L9Y8_9BACL|nr:hypothetical protein [Jeotgalibacillus salarius]TFD99469.1 hypothetical protein E2626_14515 [Jeotgalibacillus salarius]
MVKKLTLLLTLLLLSACASNNLENTTEVKVSFWKGEEPGSKKDIIQEEKDVDVFVSSTADAEELEPARVIKTAPLLQYSLVQDEEVLDYHLWISENDEGYIQSLRPEESRTYQLDTSSIESLKNLLLENDNEVLLDEISFE